jgi:hypothetical protein
VLLCASVVGCGGEQAAGKASSEAGAPADPCALAKSVTTHVLMDFDNGPPLGYVSGDGTGTITPGDGKPPPSPFTEPRCGETGMALHVIAKGLTNFGPSVGLSLADNKLVFDATGYVGLSFWARQGSDDSGSALLATVQDSATLGDKNGVCSDAAAGDKGKCDPFGRAVGIESAWRLYLIPFDSMRQKGYGVPASGLDVSAIQGFKISGGKGDWDFWLDDIAIYKAGQP